MIDIRSALPTKAEAVIVSNKIYINLIFARQGGVTKVELPIISGKLSLVPVVTEILQRANISYIIKTEFIDKSSIIIPGVRNYEISTEELFDKVIQVKKNFSVLMERMRGILRDIEEQAGTIDLWGSDI